MRLPDGQINERAECKVIVVVNLASLKRHDEHTDRGRIDVVEGLKNRQTDYQNDTVTQPAVNRMFRLTTPPPLPQFILKSTGGDLREKLQLLFRIELPRRFRLRRCSPGCMKAALRADLAAAIPKLEKLLEKKSFLPPGRAQQVLLDRCVILLYFVDCL